MAQGTLNAVQTLQAVIGLDVYTKAETNALLDLKADKSTTYTKTETDALLSEKANADSVYTKAEADALLDEKADADAVYTKTETDNLLDGKADKSTTLAGYGITDAYTKTQTDTLLNGKADADSVYTKTEINTKIPNTVGSATKPVYVNGGVVSPCTYELNKTVPANAVFTDHTYTAGNGLNLSGTSFSAKAGTNVTVDGGGINVNGNGVVASVDSGLVSGGTAYTELRPTLDGTWVKNAQTTATNLQKLEGGIEYLYGLLSHQYDQLKKYINGNYYDYDTDTDSKYTKTVPQGAMPYASLEQIGGKTLVWNQLATFTAGTVTDNGITWTKNADGTITASGTATAVSFMNVSAFLSGKTGHKMLIRGCPSGGSTATYFIYDGYSTSGESGDVGSGKIYTVNTPTVICRCYIKAGTVISTPITFTPQYVDLTLMFGSGNEPTTVAEFTAQFPAVWYAYNPGTLLSAGVTSVVSKKADTTTIATYSIPAEIRNLEGYGWSAGSVYNYVDFERKVFVQNVASITLNGTETWAKIPGGTNKYFYVDIGNYGIVIDHQAVADTLEVKTINANNTVEGLDVINSSSYNKARILIRPPGYTAEMTAEDMETWITNHPTTVHYALSTPIETDISEYITDDNLISVEAGGSLTFPNSNGDDYRIDVPSAETYMIDLQASLGE